jgi:thiol-disulfide isomerase/thioredoxin
MQRVTHARYVAGIMIPLLVGCTVDSAHVERSKASDEQGQVRRQSSIAQPAGENAKEQRGEEELVSRLSEFASASHEDKARTVGDAIELLTGGLPGEADIGIARRVAHALEYDDPALAQRFGDRVGSHFAELALAVPDADWIVGWARRQSMVGKPLEIIGQTIQGDDFDWAAYRGKIVLVEFWATWCGPCHDELANTLALYDRYGDRGFDVVGVATDDHVGQVRSFVREADLPWTTIHGPAGAEGSLSRRFGILWIPAGILVDRDGEVLSIHARGSELEQRLVQYVESVD